MLPRMIEIGIQIHVGKWQELKGGKIYNSQRFLSQRINGFRFFFTIRIGDTAYTGDLQFSLSKTNDGIGDTKPNI